MHPSRPSRKRIEAALFLAVVAALFGFGSLGYDIGTVNRMGPGFLPLALSVVMAGLSLLVLLTPDADEQWGDSGNTRPYWAVLSSIAVFAVAISNSGLMPAVFLTTIVAMLGSEGFKLSKAMLLGTTAAVLAAGIFVYGLGLPIPLFRNPF